MTDAEIATIGKLADMCRSKGIRILVNDGFRIELGPVMDETSTAKAGPDPEVCRCGHQMHRHMNALCVDGCDPDKCAGPESGG